jgi:hypothetical protein
LRKTLDTVTGDDAVLTDSLNLKKATIDIGGNGAQMVEIAQPFTDVKITSIFYRRLIKTKLFPFFTMDHQSGGWALRGRARVSDFVATYAAFQ